MKNKRTDLVKRVVREGRDRDIEIILEKYQRAIQELNPDGLWKPLLEDWPEDNHEEPNKKHL